MASAFIEGKVLVIINDHKSRCPDIHCYPQAAQGKDREGALSALYEDVPLHIGLDVKSVLSKRQMALPEGTTFRIAMTVVLSYHSDYWGEWDSDLEVVKQRTLREQLPNSKLRRKWKLFDKQEAKKQKAKEFKKALAGIDLTLPKGVSDQIFEDIRELDRACGRVKLGEAFLDRIHGTDTGRISSKEPQPTRAFWRLRP